jgi:geranylgeranylglycerol-phosphate geranylgeranyltransferase
VFYFHYNMISFTTNGNRKQEVKDQSREGTSFVKSQLLLFQSRSKWGMLYSLATATGLFFVPGVLRAMMSESSFWMVLQNTMLLPLISLLVTVGMFVLNDLVDADLDKVNGKKRPIPSGMVSKRRAWTFILSTNGMALLLSIVTFNLISILIVSLMLVIGISYSAPKIALMKRFVVKTVTIAVYYCLCSLLGMTSIYGLGLVTNNPFTLIHSLSMLAIMIFISSTLNDLGDVDGDRAADRRTVPIVIGKGNTIKLSMVLAAAMLPITWALYSLALLAGDRGSMVTGLLTSVFALFVASKMAAMRRGLLDTESMRRHHKKLFPLNIVLQSSLVVAGLGFL